MISSELRSSPPNSELKSESEMISESLICQRSDSETADSPAESESAAGMTRESRKRRLGVHPVARAGPAAHSVDCPSQPPPPEILGPALVT
jgi:hypothetical protein